MRTSALASAFVFCLFTGITTCFSQNVSVSELITLIQKADINLANDLLYKKGWEYYTSVVGDDQHMNKISWTFNKNPYEDKAQGWLHLFTYDNKPGKIGYSFFNTQAYNTIVNSISTTGFKQTGNEILDNEISTNYTRSDYILTVNTTRIRNEDQYSQEGSVAAYTVTLIKREGDFDVDNGLKKSYDADGNLESEYRMKDGMKNGEYRSYHPNGKVLEEATFVNGHKQGISKEYNSNGLLIGEFTNLDSELHGPYKIYENAKLKMTGSFDHGAKTGHFVLFLPDGKPDKEFDLKNEVFEGPSCGYFYEGENLKEKVCGTFINNKKTGIWRTYSYNDSIPVETDFDTYTEGQRIGPFKRSAPDSIVFGTWNLETYEGPYKVYRKIPGKRETDLKGDTSLAFLAVTGNYRESLMQGNWKYYFPSGALAREGEYEKGLKSGSWKSYFDLFTDAQGNPYPCSKTLFLSETYTYGEKTGKEYKFYETSLKKPSCDDSPATPFHPADTCHWTLTKVDKMTTYLNGEINGPYEEKNSEGKIVAQGTLKKQTKEGVWTEGTRVQNPDGSSYYVYCKGNYSYNVRIGLWTEFVKENQKTADYQYEEGKLHGKTILYDDSQRAYEEKEYQKGVLQKITCLNPKDPSITCIFDQLKTTDAGISCRRTDYKGKARSVQVYTLQHPITLQVQQTPEMVLEHYRKRDFSDVSQVYPDGNFQSFDTAGRILSEGTLYKEKKTGTWKEYYYDVQVYTLQVFANDSIQPEMYFDMEKQKPFSGKFEQEYPNGKTRIEFRISDGLRDGKSRYYDEKGDLIKTEKYDNGKLKT